MRKTKILISVALIMSMTTMLTTGCMQKTASTEGYVQVYETTGTKSKLMSRESDLTFSDIDDTSVNAVVSIDEKQIKQEVEGFGGALTHASAYVLSKMSADDRRSVLETLYSTEKGAAFQMVRVPIGASDYTTYINGEMEYFTLDDMPEGATDEKLEHFNTKYDEQELIPVLQEILEINPNIEVVAASWSAPAWMKESKVLNRGSLAQEYEETYADYLVKYVKAYKEKGINIKYLSVQNEPLVDNMRYPVMTMDEYQMARLIKYTGEKLKKEGLETRLLAYDHNYDSSVNTTVDDFATEIFESDAKKYVDGIALHGYGTFQAPEEFAEGFRVYNEKYDTKSFLTEIAEGTWSADFASNLSYSLENMILTPLNYGSSGSIYWNVVLYDDGTPAKTTNDCLGVVNVSKKDSSVSKNSAYYAMAHISKYVYTEEGNPKVISCESEDPSVLASAFLRGDGHVVTVVTNLSDKYATNVDVHYDEKSFTYEIQPQSVVTFVW